MGDGADNDVRQPADQAPNTFKLPRNARRPSRLSGYTAHLSQATSHGGSPSRATWVATTRDFHVGPGSTSRDVTGSGTTLAEATAELTCRLQHDIDLEYLRMDMEPAPEVAVFPVYPPDVEVVLEEFRERWRETREEQREAVAVGPAALGLTRLGLVDEDVAWILDRSPALIRQHVAGADPRNEGGRPPTDRGRLRPPFG